MPVLYSPNIVSVLCGWANLSIHSLCHLLYSLLQLISSSQQYSVLPQLRSTLLRSCFHDASTNIKGQ